MMKWLYTTTFKARIRISMILLTVTALVVSGSTSYFIAAGILESKSYQLNQGMIDKSAQALEEKLRKVRLAVLTFMSSDQFNQLILSTSSNKQLDYFNHFKLNQSLQTPIFQMKLVEPGITSIFIKTPAGEFYSSNEERLKGASFEDSLIYPLLEKYRLPAWVESHEDDLFESRNKVLSLLFVPIIQNTSNVHVVVNVSDDILSDYLLKNSGDARLIVFTENNQLAFETDELSRLLAAEPEFRQRLVNEKGHFEYTFNRTRYLVNYSTVSFPDNWMMVHLISRNTLLKDVQLIQWVTLSTIFLFALLAMFMSGKLTRMLLRPLNHLQSVMKKVEQEDLSIRFEGRYEDELTHVGLRFNSMLDRVEMLIQERMAAEQAERIAEMKALQAQINPHFLYNTLNTILWKSHSGQQEDVREMIMSLSILFRTGLNSGEEMTTIGKELENVTQYLRIQKLCYAHLFVYEIICDKESEELPILKLLLQPLVENSILHGFKDLQGGGVVRICIEQQQDILQIEVQDNGQGFNTSLVDTGIDNSVCVEHSGFALNNIRQRLALYYRDAAELSISSNSNTGTIIKIKIPMEFKKDDEG
ncbi:sensor histidine kinase [Paenibacillus sp. FSL R7-0345]|uniref:sensor histidine kinase n=1 Tax=Paenibacillus sp. FSL R7-0345 TaxID=2954535 RepID=UPI00315AA33A